MNPKSTRARSTMKASARAMAGLPEPARRSSTSPGVTTAELEEALGDMYRAPSLRGLDLID